MNKIFKSLIVVMILVVSMGLFATSNVNAQIFKGSVESDDPSSVGYCLHNPDVTECNDIVFGTICKNPTYQNSLTCLSEAYIGTGLAKDSLSGSGITHTDNAGDLIIKYINFMLPYLTLAAFVGFVVAGFFYVTAFGNEEQLGKAKKILIWSVVGLLLVMASYTIVQLLTRDLLEGLQPVG